MSGKGLLYNLEIQLVSNLHPFAVLSIKADTKTIQSLTLVKDG